jgi:phosphoribosylaminoimidazolecarboxamide formyltransferase/IMP cyclohydrolase
LRRHPELVTGSVQPKLSERVAHQTNWLESGRLSPALRHSWLSELMDAAMVSDGAIPFRDNIDEARRHGVRFIAEPGGSLRSEEVATQGPPLPPLRAP